jgi:hypothetical protein
MLIEVSMTPMNWVRRYRLPATVLIVALAGAVFVTERTLASRRTVNSPEQLLAKLREVLKRDHPVKVIVLSVADAGQKLDDVTSGELERAALRLLNCCEELSIPAEQVDVPGHLELSHARMPEPTDLAETLETHAAGAALIAVRRQTRTGATYRFVLMNDLKIVWSGRLTTPRITERDPALAAGKRARWQARSGNAGGMRGPAGIRLTGLPVSHAAALANGATAVGQGQAFGLLAQLGAGGDAVSTADLPSFNSRILQFAADHLGQQVGNGQCWTLAAEALETAGAQPPDRYDFGVEVALTDLLAGDVLYFHDARFVTADSWFHLGAPDHVAIVGEVQGSAVAIYHQNVNGAMIVRRDAIDLASLQSGQVIGYRATAPNGH